MRVFFAIAIEIAVHTQNTHTYVLKWWLIGFNITTQIAGFSYQLEAYVQQPISRINLYSILPDSNYCHHMSTFIVHIRFHTSASTEIVQTSISKSLRHSISFTYLKYSYVQKLIVCDMLSCMSHTGCAVKNIKNRQIRTTS